MKIFTLTLFVLFSMGTFAQNLVTDAHHSNRVGFEKNSNSRSGEPIFFEAPSVAYIDSMIQLLMIGGCVDVTNIQYTGRARAAGYLVDTTNTLGINHGVVLTTGLVEQMAGPNDQANTSVNNYSQCGQCTSGDADLDVLSAGTTYDATVVEFDFIPHGDTIFVADFVFGSEEYPEYANTQFNDVFGFFIDGPSTNGPVNAAVLPGSSIPIAINNINNGFSQTLPSSGPCENCQYYTENENGSLYEYDAFTTPMHLEYPVIAGETYHFKVAIADVGDRIYDSGVIIKAQSFCGDSWLQIAEFEAQPQGGLTYQFDNQSQRADYFVWDFGDGNTSYDVEPTHTYASPGMYTVTLTASNDCFDTLAVHEVNAMVTDVASIENEVKQFDINTLNLGNYILKFSSQRAEKVSLTIMDVQGRAMMSQDFGTTSKLTQNLDLSSLSSGIYVAQLRVGNQVLVERIVR